jgi:UDP-glucose 4-epimerase
MDALSDGDARFYNLGLGKGDSVKEVIESVRRVSGRDIAVRSGDRRPGDVPELFADSTKIRRELGWQPQITELDEIVATAWEWFREHPKGYGTKP